MGTPTTTPPDQSVNSSSGSAEGSITLSTESVIAGPLHSKITSLEQEMAARPTPEKLIDLSLLYWQEGRFQDCIATAKKALVLRPRYAEAWNNISAAHHATGDWNAAIAAATEALKIAPNYRLAKNNLAQSLAEKRKAR